MKFAIFLFPALLLTACESTLPTVEQLDSLEARVRQERQADYAALERQRASGEITAQDYEMQRASLDKAVRDKVDTMVWSRHALAQSERKANGIPTADQPVDNPPPMAGQIANSLYTSARSSSGMGTQVQGNLMGNVGGPNFNENRKPGTMFDPD